MSDKKGGASFKKNKKYQGNQKNIALICRMIAKTKCLNRFICLFLKS